MPSDASGNYTLPVGYLATTGGTIQISQHNPPLEDLAAAATARLMRSGAAPMTGPLKLTDGIVGAPAIAFASAPSTGIHKTTAGIGFDVSGTQVAEIGPAGILSGVVTASIADKAVTLAKLYHPTAASRLLGSDSNAALVITSAVNNGSGLIRLSVADTTTFATSQVKTVSDVTGTTEANGTWTITVIDATHIDLQGSTFVNAYVSGGTIGGGVEEISLGTGLQLVGSILKAPALPVPGGFKNLSIKVASNTTVTVAADFVTTTDGTTFQTTAVSGTVNLGTNGAANALDAGTIAIDTWYSIWAIAKADGTTGALASTSATAPTLPTGYTFKARIGWVRTIHATATLYGTWQLGRDAQYVVGLAQTAALPIIDSGSKGSVSVPTYISASVSNFVPSTASKITMLLAIQSAGTQGIVAPNSSYGNFNSTTNPPPMSQISPAALTASTLGTFVLESTNVSWASTGAGNLLMCMGWVDNI